MELVIFLFALYCKYPNNVVLLRGNHEFRNSSEEMSIVEEVSDVYGQLDLVNSIYNVFECLPIACLIQEQYFCIHGGISPGFRQISDLDTLEYPIVDDSQQLATDVLWSDPTSSTTSFLKNSRGKGYYYGITAVQEFMNNNNIKYIIRAHQCVEKGVKISHKCVITVFSSSCYGDLENYAGFLIIDGKAKLHYRRLDPLKHIKRSRAVFNMKQSRQFERISMQGTRVMRSQMISSSKMMPGRFPVVSRATHRIRGPNLVRPSVSLQ